MFSKGRQQQSTGVPQSCLSNTRSKHMQHLVLVSISKFHQASSSWTVLGYTSVMREGLKWNATMSFKQEGPVQDCGFFPANIWAPTSPHVEGCPDTACSTAGSLGKFQRGKHPGRGNVCILFSTTVCFTVSPKAGGKSPTSWVSKIRKWWIMPTLFLALILCPQTLETLKFFWP